METESIVLEHLRAIRSKLDRIDKNVDDLREQMVGMRVREHADHGDDVRRDRQIMRLEDEVERIKQRLDLVD